MKEYTTYIVVEIVTEIFNPQAVRAYSYSVPFA